MFPSSKILVVDDAADLQELLQRSLRLEGFETRGCGSAGEIRSATENFVPDVIILDVDLPDASGFDLIGELRARFHAKILMLTAMGEPDARIDGLELGADDYVPKPFDLLELKARIRALLRRHRPADDSAAHGSGEGFDGWVFDRGRRELVTPANERVKLTDTECTVLSVLLENANNPVERDALLSQLREKGASASSRTLDGYVADLRKKFGEKPGDLSRIHTVVGVGYVLTATAVRAVEHHDVEAVR